MIYSKNKIIDSIYRTEYLGKILIARSIDTIYYNSRIVWEVIKGNFITKDKFYIKTKDGLILNAKE